MIWVTYDYLKFDYHFLETGNINKGDSGWSLLSTAFCILMGFTYMRIIFLLAQVILITFQRHHLSKPSALVTVLFP